MPVVNLHTLTCFLAVKRCQDMLFLCLPCTHILCAPELLAREIEREKEMQVCGGFYELQNLSQQWMSGPCSLEESEDLQHLSEPSCVCATGAACHLSAAFTLLPSSPQNWACHSRPQIISLAFDATHWQLLLFPALVLSTLRLRLRVFPWATAPLRPCGEKCLSQN